MRNLSIVSEAATHIPDYVRTFASEINWQQYIGAHNQLIHNYWGINNDIVWGIIKGEIPVLIKQLRALKKAADENQIRQPPWASLCRRRQTDHYYQHLSNKGE